MNRRDWLSHQPFTLLLGAGFFGFYAHTGLLLALEEEKLVPSRIVGVSAGALAGGLWASGMSARSLERELRKLERTDFWDPGLPLGGLLRGRKFAQKLRVLLGDTECRDLKQCRVPFHPVVHDVVTRRPVVVREGPVDVAIRASCTVPFMFRPVWHQRRLWVDGGVSDRSGFSALQSGERVLFHYLPSRRRFGVPPTPTAVPDADALMLLTPSLPKVSPFALDRGPLALERTRDFVLRWLDEPVSESAVSNQA